MISLVLIKMFFIYLVLDYLISNHANVILHFFDIFFFGTKNIDSALAWSRPLTHGIYRFQRCELTL